MSKYPINYSIKKKYERLKRDTWNNKHFYKQAKHIRETLKNSKQTEEEKKLWKQFLENVEKDKNAPEQLDDLGHGKFRLKHIEDLKVNYDILFVYGKKGIGKTVQLGRLVNKIAEEHPQGIVVLLRNTGQEMEGLAKQLATSENWPIYMKGHTLYHKIKKKGGESRYMGFATFLTGEAIKACQGPEYKNVKAIIWDECNYTGSRFGISPKDLTKFVIFVSSIVRDNKNVKFYMFGNYLRTEDEATGNIFLESAGINPESRLKLITFKTPNGKDETRMLYINTGNLYKGLESQKYVGLFGDKIVQDLVDNLPKARSLKIVSLSDFLNCSPIWAFVFTWREQEIILFFSQATLNVNEPSHFVCRVETYDQEKTYMYLPFTDEINVYNKYGPKMILKNREEVEFHLWSLFFALWNGKVWYSGEGTERFFRTFLIPLGHKYGMYYENSECA